MYKYRINFNKWYELVYIFNFINFFIFSFKINYEKTCYNRLIFYIYYALFFVKIVSYDGSYTIIALCLL